MASTPRIIRRQTPSHGPSLEENLISLVHRPAACSGVKALRNTSDAKAASRQALLAFRSLDPFRARREPDRRRRDEERPFPLRTKNRQQSPNEQRINCPAPGQQPLDKKSPIQVCKLSVPSVLRDISDEPAEQVLREIRRSTRRQFSAEEKIRIAVSGLRDRGRPSQDRAIRPRRGTDNAAA